jgi:predicted component of type VI protein secretion system
MATAIKFGIGLADQPLQHEVSRQGKRPLTRDAGRALQLLGHAIEYLTDEYIHETSRLCASDPQVEAIQLLMRLNRQVYYECPVVPTVAERVASFFRTIKA